MTRAVDRKTAPLFGRVPAVTADAEQANRNATERIALHCMLIDAA